MRPLKADVPLRLKSPSSPWPTASCSSTPGQPAPSTTVMVPAGAGTASRLTCAVRTASFTSCAPALGRQELGVGEATAAAGVALLAAAVLLDDDADVEPHQRPHVAGERAVARHDQHDVVRRRQARHDLRDARIERARLAVDLLEQLAPCRRRRGTRPDRPAGTGGDRPWRARPARCRRRRSARSRARRAPLRAAPAASLRRNRQSRSSRRPARARRRPARCCGRRP